MSFLSRAIHHTKRMPASRNYLPFRFAVNELRHSACRIRSFATTTAHRLERESLILYRQLLRLCRGIDSDIPLETFYEGFAVGQPLVDAVTLWEQITTGGRHDNEHAITRNIFPESAHYDEQRQAITVPLRSSADIRNLIRGLYRINAEANVDNEVLQERVAMTVQSLELLKEQSVLAKSFQASRARHLDRTGVAFRVGQVVMHKKARWQGIVVGWDRAHPLPEGRRTSMTTKEYAIPEEMKGGLIGDRIRYFLILDSSDAFLKKAGVAFEDGEFQYVFQSLLDPVSDGLICRMQNDPFHVYFDRYETTSKTFVPSELMQYQYPSDTDMKALEVDDEEREALCSGVSQTIQRFASRLNNRLIVPAFKEALPEIMYPVLQQVRAMCDGDSSADGKQLTISTHAILQLDRLLKLTAHLAAVLQKRLSAKKVVNRLRFQLGDIVQSKTQGVRGIVVGWERKQSVDVCDTDGFKVGDDPKDTLLYHIIMDKSGIEKLEVEHSETHVCECEDNLEKCHAETVLDMGIVGPAWERAEAHARYIVPASLRVGHNVNAENHAFPCLTRNGCCHSSSMANRAMTRKWQNECA